MRILAFSAILALSACTPAARQQAGAAISTLGPALCSALVPLIDSSGSQAGLVCSDAAKLLGGAIQIAHADSRPTMVEVAGPAGATCEPVMLHDVLPDRDPREYVCRGALDEQAIRRAFSVGHAR